MRFTRPEPKVYAGDRDRLIYFRPSASTKVHISKAVQPQTEEYISYGVEVRHEELHWCIWRRFSEFNFIHESIALPSRLNLDFPKKVWFGNRTQAVIIERRNALNRYLESLMQSEAALKHPHLQSFLAPNYLLLFCPTAAPPLYSTTQLDPMNAHAMYSSSPARLQRGSESTNGNESRLNSATPATQHSMYMSYKQSMTDSVLMSMEDLERFKKEIVTDVTSAILNMMKDPHVDLQLKPSSPTSTVDSHHSLSVDKQSQQLIQNEVEIWKRRAMDLQRENEKLWSATRQGPLPSDNGQRHSVTASQATMELQCENEKLWRSTRQAAQFVPLPTTDGQGNSSDALYTMAAAATPSYGRDSDGPASLQTPRRSTEEQPAPSYHDPPTSEASYQSNRLTQARLEKLGQRHPSFGYSILHHHKRTMSQQSQISMLSHASPHLRHNHPRSLSTLSGVSNLTTRSTPASFLRTRLPAPRHRKFQSFQTLLSGPRGPREPQETPLSERYGNILSPATTARLPMPPSPVQKPRSPSPTRSRSQSSDSAPTTLSSSGAPAPPSEIGSSSPEPRQNTKLVNGRKAAPASRAPHPESMPSSQIIRKDDVGNAASNEESTNICEPVSG